MLEKTNAPLAPEELEEAKELLHVIEGVCTETTQGETWNELRFQAGLIERKPAKDDITSLHTTVRLNHLPAGSPLEYGKRYRVTIEELP